MDKAKKLLSLKKVIRRLKQKGKRIVFTNGCFDLLHPGHIKILKEAKSQGDVLVVGLNSDSSVRKIKGLGRPVMSERSRVELVAALRVVDYVILFTEETPYNLIKELKPDVLVKGGDWPKDRIVGRKLVKKIYRVKLKPGYSSTGLIKKIGKYGK